jgi:hypothetical protein
MSAGKGLVFAIVFLASAAFFILIGWIMSPIPSRLHIYNYSKYDKQCVAWTDGCRGCYRSVVLLGTEYMLDRETCSNITIACQPKEIITCTRHGSPAPTATSPSR